MVTDKAVTQQSGLEKVVQDGVVQVDKSFSEKRSSGFDGQTALHESTKTITDKGRMNNIIHGSSTQVDHQRNGVDKSSVSAVGGTSQVQVKKLVGGKWVTRTVTEKVADKHDTHSEKQVRSSVSKQEHSVTKSTSSSSITQHSSTSQSTKLIGGKLVHVKDTTDSSTDKIQQSQTGRNQHRGSSSIVLGEESSSVTKQSTTSKIIGGKLVHVSGDDHRAVNGAQNKSVNNITHSESTSVAKSSKSESSQSKQSSQIITSESTAQSDKHFNRKSTFSSENTGNTILCRQAQPTIQPASSSLSVSGSIQRKSISNLNDSAMYATTNRTSYSSLHRRDKESVDSRMNNYLKTLESGTITNRSKVQPCPPPTLTTSVTNMGTTSSRTIGGQHSGSTHQQSSKVLRDYHTALNTTKSSTKANASSISFSDDNKFHGTSSYKMQYVQQNDGRCPAHAINDNLKISKVTKQHTYYTHDRR